MPIIGITGTALSGKDTLCRLLLQKLPNARRFALADELKSDLQSFFEEKVGISPWTCDIKEKTLVRPYFVAHGCFKRAQTEGTYWTKKLQPKIDDAVKRGITPIISDIRFDQYPFDELYWLKSTNKGILIHVKRICREGRYVLPANEDERVNDPKMQAAADFQIVWPTLDNEEDLMRFIPTALYDEKSLHYH